MRKANLAEYEAVKSFYWDLIDKMQDRTDTVGWKKGIYPSNDFLQENIKNGNLYLLENEDGIAACVVINNLWNEGYEGITWAIDCKKEEVLVPHALAVKPDLQQNGLGKQVVQDIISIAKKTGKKTIRLDILAGNIAAERLYTQMGFKYVQKKTMFYEDTGWTDFIMYELVL